MDRKRNSNWRNWAINGCFLASGLMVGFKGAKMNNEAPVAENQPSDIQPADENVVSSNLNAQSLDSSDSTSTDDWQPVYPQDAQTDSSSPSPSSSQLAEDRSEDSEAEKFDEDKHGDEHNDKNEAVEDWRPVSPKRTDKVADEDKPEANLTAIQTAGDENKRDRDQEQDPVDAQLRDNDGWRRADTPPRDLVPVESTADRSPAVGQDERTVRTKPNRIPDATPEPTAPDTDRSKIAADGSRDQPRRTPTERKVKDMAPVIATDSNRTSDRAEIDSTGRTPARRPNVVDTQKNESQDNQRPRRSVEPARIAEPTVQPSRVPLSRSYVKSSGRTTVSKRKGSKKVEAIPPGQREVLKVTPLRKEKIRPVSASTKRAIAGSDDDAIKTEGSSTESDQATDDGDKEERDKAVEKIENELERLQRALRQLQEQTDSEKRPKSGQKRSKPKSSPRRSTTFAGPSKQATSSAAPDTRRSVPQRRSQLNNDAL